MINTNKIEKYDWLISTKFKEPTDNSIKLIKEEIEIFKKKKSK